MPITVIAQQGDTVDLLCLRHLGSTAGVTEAVYALNRGLAERGPVLSLGQAVALPDRPTNSPTVATVQLWD
ncbi:tail protein X [Variovorax paradoxus]|uniref:tail protein X n=1 Tax=Variovorax paradoxus TaxID=34073 RepID=UPI003F513C19